MRIRIPVLFTLACCSLSGIVWLIAQKDRPAAPVASSKPEGNVAPAIASPATIPDSPLWETPLLAETWSKDELLDAARNRVALDIVRALNWASSQENPILRDRLQYGVLQAWGEIDPAAAVAWALDQDESQRFMNMEAVMMGAAKQPIAALQITRDLINQNPESGDHCAAMLIGALSRLGDFQSALSLVMDTPAEAHAYRASSIFSLWGQTQPEAAANALNTISDPDTFNAAFSALIDSWSKNDPQELISYTLTVPAGETRNIALAQAFDHWSLQDPAAMADWLSLHTDLPEYDFGSALLLLKSDEANRDVSTALDCAKSIRNTEFRQIAMERVILEWAASDPAAAKQYLQESTDLTQSERRHLSKNLATHFGIVSESD